MTGFGRGEASANGITATLEIKSLNSRYCDINIRLPQLLQDYELKLRERVQGKVERGKVNVTVRLDMQATGEPEVTFDEKLLKGYRDLLQNMQQEAGIEEPIRLEHLMNFSEIFVSREKDDATIEACWKLVRSATDDALENLNRMRHQEGEQLKNDLDNRVQQIDDHLETIKTLVKDRVPEARDKLLERIQNLIDDDSFDKERLELEVAVLADKMDVTEEIVRLQSHIKFFRQALGQNQSVGRRLNFLLQEMNREINTIGSKANSSEISHHVVQVKETLEKIREQVQNIE